MPKLNLNYFLLIILTILLGCNAQKDDGWKELFPNDSLQGWQSNQKKFNWSLKNGVLHSTGKPIGILYSTKKYKNFEIKFDWKHHKYAGNSGLFIWIKKIQKRLAHGTEIQVLDPGYETYYAKAYKKRAKNERKWFTGHGDVFPVGTKMTPFLPKPPGAKQRSRSFPTQNRTKTHGQWNHYHIKAINGVVRLSVNGKEVSGGYNISPSFGAMAFESEGSPVSFKNIMIKQLPDDAIDGGLLQKIDTEKAQKKFLEQNPNAIALIEIKNGKADFSEWKNLTKKPRIIKQEYIKVPKHTPKTKRVFSDFKLFTVFKLDHKANSGIFIRFADKGSFMCEVQMLDNTNKVYRKLDPRQYHGSVYGVVPAKTGYQASVGQWNYQEIIVKAHRIKVILNGHTIIDTDVSKAKPPFYKNHKHLGLLNLKGRIGLGGHAEGVYYRSMYVVPIK